jgi:mono/diheme cytochrome c family protein
MQTKKLLGLFILMSMSLLFVMACSPTAPEAPAAQAQSADNDEHQEEGSMQHGSGNMAHEHAEVPHEFEALTNPFRGNDEALAAGQVIFETNCAVCHGPQGKGDGPGSTELNPKPADLSDGQMMHDLTDGYLFWRVSEGGQMEPFNSAMPPWKESLSEEQRWQVISYVRSFTEGEAGHSDEGEHHADEAEHMDDEAEHHEDEGEKHIEEEHHEEGGKDMEEEHHEEASDQHKEGGD